MMLVEPGDGEAKTHAQPGINGALYFALRVVFKLALAGLGLFLGLFVGLVIGLFTGLFQFLC